MYKTEFKNYVLATITLQQSSSPTRTALQQLLQDKITSSSLTKGVRKIFEFTISSSRLDIIT